MQCPRCSEYNAPSASTRYVRCLECLGRGVTLDGRVCRADGCGVGRIGMVICPDCKVGPTTDGTDGSSTTTDLITRDASPVRQLTTV